MKAVLFLGAGFSKPFGLPVMADFFREAGRVASLKAPESELLDRMQRAARAGVGMLAGQEQNLEHVLSFSMFVERIMPGLETETAEVAISLKRILFKVYSSFGWTRNTQGLVDSLGAVLHQATHEQRDTEITVITTNYDLLAEYALMRGNAAPFLPGDWEYSDSRRNRLYSSEHTTATICKLHGSVNWFLNAAGKVEVECGMTERIATVEDDNFGKHERWICPMVASPDYSLKGPPLISPPMFFKPPPDPMTSAAWKYAWNALQGADKVAFIGYSFPDSDPYMRYFIASALSGNLRFEDVDVIDPNARTIVERLGRSHAAKFGETLSGRLRPIDKKWQEAGYRLLG